jgi:hypothetical protein
MHDNDDQPAGSPVPRLDRLYADRELPPALERRVLDGLRSSGLIGTRHGESADAGAPVANDPSRDGRQPSRRAWRVAGLRSAAALVVFAAGWWVGATREETQTVAPTATSVAPDATGVAAEQQFMLLLWEGRGFATGIDPAAAAAEYAAWAGSVARSGVRISGDELGTERAVVGSASAGPSADGARVGGYFLVEVANIEEARGLLAGHPHLANGGAIEIAPIVTR